MEPKTNYTVVGLAVVLLTFGLIITGIWLSIGLDKKSYHFYTVYMHEPVASLTQESLVKYNGVTVGYVEKIALNKNNPQEVRLILKIEDGTPITESTVATLITQGITGATYLGLSATSPSLKLITRKPGEEYPVIPTRPSFFGEIEKNVRDISASIKRVFNAENAENIRKTLINLDKTMRVISKNDVNINKFLKDLPKMINNFNMMSEDMAMAGKNVTEAMKAGKTGINKISQQAVPPFIFLLRRLDSIAANLETVSAQIRRNPAVLLRGNSAPKPGPGE